MDTTAEKNVLNIKSIEDLFEAAGMGHVEIEQKANENLNTGTNTNWYNAYGIANAIKDLTSERGQLMSRLTEGFEGNELPVSYPIPYNITQYFMLGKTQWADEARPAFDNQAVTDSSSTLTQVSFILQMAVSDEMIKHSTDKQLFDKVVAMLSKSAISTMEGCIINGDIETGATGNVNSDDQAPATTFGTAQYHSLKIDHGIRELAINNSLTVDVGAFDSDDILAVIRKMGAAYKTKFSDIAVIFEPSTYLTALTDDALKLKENSSKPAIDGSKPSPWVLDMFAHDLVPTTEADGKVSATPANNTLGQFVAVYKPAIRWGFGSKAQVEVERIQGYGYELTLTMEFGFVILDGTHTVALGRNVTIA